MMSTQETREEFRARIQGVLTGAEREYERRTRTPPMSSLAGRAAWLQEMEITAAVAVYAQALRDVVDEFGGILSDPDSDVPERLSDEIHAWAWHKGIELGEASDEWPA